jgi:hypothetical protein
MYAELRLGQGLTVSRKRVAGLLRLTGAGLKSAATLPETTQAADAGAPR